MTAKGEGNRKRTKLPYGPSLKSWIISVEISNQTENRVVKTFTESTNVVNALTYLRGGNNCDAHSICKPIKMFLNIDTSSTANKENTIRSGPRICFGEKKKKK